MVKLTSKLKLLPQDRILILSPHPDDEVLGCGGIIQEAISNNLPIQICFLTYGDANELSFIDYYKRLVVRSKTVENLGLIRHKEAIKADTSLGVKSKDIIFLGYPDLGNLNIWESHWGSSKPFKSILTRVNKVPYNNAFHPQAPYKGEEILKDLENIIKSFKPTKIFVTMSVDQHPDHKAFYLFTQIVLWNLEKDIKPEVYPYLVHHSVKKWPLPQGYYPNEKIIPPDLLGKIITWQEYNLDSEKVQKKFDALKDHNTQYKYDHDYLDSFIRSNEIFGDFPFIRIDSNKPRSIIPDEAGGLVRIIPEFVTNLEKAMFVGFESWLVYKKDKYLNFKVKFTRLFSKKVDLSFYIFGYRKDKAFFEMPKLKIKTYYDKCNIYNQEDKIADKGINIVRGHKKIEIKIPMKLLNEPQKILFAGKSYRKKILLDWISWRKIKI